MDLRFRKLSRFAFLFFVNLFDSRLGRLVKLLDSPAGKVVLRLGKSMQKEEHNVIEHARIDLPTAFMHSLASERALSMLT